jgi:uncharacterized protein
MKNVSVLVKPASGLCNMRCRYCFYRDVAGNRAQADLGMMSLETAERLIRAAFGASEAGGAVSFAFQGGEPTLAGLGFYENFVHAVRERKPPGVSVQYSIQTNGLLMDSGWAGFLRANGFLVGLSVDGTKDIHDFLRVDAGEKGSWNRAMKALALLQRQQADVNLLCVVTRMAARRPQGVYAALKKLGIRHLQFIPCLDPLGEARGGHSHSLNPGDYADFLRALFDAWHADWQNGQYVSVRLFDDYVRLFMGMPPGTCATSGRCGGYFVVEADGGVYPCDFYMLDHWLAGNIRSDSFQDIADSPRWRRFCQESLEKPEECRACEWASFCRGGCRRDWTDEGGRHNYYCSAFKAFFAHAGTRLAEIAQAELRMREAHRLP